MKRFPATAAKRATATRLHGVAAMAVAAVLLLLSSAGPAQARERILAYDIAVEVAADGSLDVVETIRVQAEGNQIRRGIYREFPTRYKDRLGNRVVVDFEMLGVTRDGAREPWFTERMDNGVRINTGNDDYLPVPADYTFALHYRTTRQLGFFDGHDELYWNAIGTDWDFPIETGSVEVRLPEPVPVERLQAGGYTGPQGAKGQDYAATIPSPGVARWRLTRPLSPREGFTIVLSFPKGIVAEPTRAQRAWWLLKDNRGVLVALLGLVLLLLFCVRRWHRIGRDPPAGTVIARYDPPPDHSPAGLRYMQRMGYDTRCFSADLLALAVNGFVRIHREDRLLLKDRWHLERLAGDASATGDAIPVARTLLHDLFPGGQTTLELVDTNASKFQRARTAHAKALEKRYQPGLFERNARSIRSAVFIGVASIGLALLVGQGTAIPATIVVAALMVPVVIAFARLVKAPTAAGRRLLDEIEGLKLYLGVAESDELARLPGPGQPPVLDAERYETLLPYAVALEVEDAWTEKFTLAVGAAAAAATSAAISWYQGGGASDLGSLTRAVGSSLSSQIASSSSPPGSSSGSGGGGSSGGGGGGGGGGGR